MNKKETIIPIAFVVISLLFVVVSAMVYLSKGKSSKWVARKMKIGALLLTFGAFQCNISGQRVTCYGAPVQNYIAIDNAVNSSVKMNIKNNNTLYGVINGVEAKGYSFAVLDKTGKTIQTGQILPKDGKLDTRMEQIKFDIEKNIKSGTYTLLLFSTAVVQQDKKHPKSKFNFIITNE